MWAPIAEVVWLAGAGVVGGVASSSGAIGSLISYPALLAVGIPPLAANVTNGVAVVGIGIGSTARSGAELADARPHLARWSAVATCGVLLGVTLLLNTSSAAFAWVVPFLVLLGAVALAVQPRVARLSGGHAALFPIGLFAVAVYEGYFGAGAGVLTLAITLLTVEPVLARANAIKNTTLGVADLVAAVALAIFGPVRWLAAVPLGVGFLVGGTIGPSVVRRVRPVVLRGVVVLAALALAGYLFASAAT